jgi:hypothetical protein
VVVPPGVQPVEVGHAVLALTPSPSSTNDVARSRSAASMISGKRSVQSKPRRVLMRTPRASRRTIRR